MIHKFFTIIPILCLLGCSSNPPIRTEKYVDLKRFMGDWYVIANIPTFIEKGAHNAIESYKLNSNGTIATTFSFYQDSFAGKRKEYYPTGYVHDTDSNAVWKMRFIWPFLSDYRIVYLDKDYSYTIIGRIKRDYVWIMARKPSIPENEYNKMVNIVRQEGYDINKLEIVPQQW